MMALLAGSQLLQDLFTTTRQSSEASAHSKYCCTAPAEILQETRRKSSTSAPQSIGMQSTPRSKGAGAVDSGAARRGTGAVAAGEATPSAVAADI